MHTLIFIAIVRFQERCEVVQSAKRLTWDQIEKEKQTKDRKRAQKEGERQIGDKKLYKMRNIGLKIIKTTSIQGIFILCYFQYHIILPYLYC